ncbi:hypothetical protein [Halopenitus persicus]|uniref:hypothetical protein n=1 Tax=Halopenitus persicus TaxID=1048396 RepID=UPI000BBABE04|nr:hypothetical protein [Halopenitus persicus]
MQPTDYLPDDAADALTLTDHLAAKSDDCRQHELDVAAVGSLDCLAPTDNRYPALTASSIVEYIVWQDHDAPEMESWTVDVEEVTNSMPADAVDTHHDYIAYVPGDVVRGVDGGLRYGVNIRLLAYAGEDDAMPTGLHVVVIAPEAHPTMMALAEARRHALAEHLAETPVATILAPDGRGLSSTSDDWAENAWEGYCRTLDNIIDRTGVQRALDDVHVNAGEE